MPNTLEQVPTFLISLDPGRAEAAIGRARRAGIGEIFLYTGFRNTGLANDLPPRRGFGGIPGEIGCFLSHMGVAKMALSLGLAKFLILEDDVVFCKGFAEKMAPILDQYPGCDVLMLGHNINWPEEAKGEPDETGRFITPYLSLWGTHAMLATANYAETISDPALEMAAAFDNQLYGKQFTGDLKIMATREILCGQDRIGMSSEIAPQHQRIVPEGFDAAE
jgi:GR25 family glycosyltransferase involved in LPS biosynthesis